MKANNLVYLRAFAEMKVSDLRYWGKPVLRTMECLSFF